MDNLLQGFTVTGAVALAVAIVVISAFIRRIIELSLPELVKDESKSGALSKTTVYRSKLASWYNELLLYALPYLVGALIAIAKVSFIYGTLDRYTDRFLFTMLIATFSAMGYKGAKKGIAAFFGVTVKDDDSTILPDIPK